MLRGHRLGACGLLALSVALVGAARAAAGPTDDIDDPKVARRLKTRTTYVSPAPATTAAVTGTPDGRPAPASAAAAAAAPVTATVEPISPVAPVAPASAVTPLRGPATEDSITRKVTPGEAPDDSSATYVPRLKLGYRRFSFVRIGAVDSASTNGVAASEPFDVISLDWYPASSFVRYGLSTQYGAESGKLAGGGDYFLAESMSLGPQIPGHVFTPFAEGFVGGGYMRRMQFGSSVPTGYWHYGIDVGTEIFMAKFAYLSVALGYMHPVNGFTKGLSLTSVYVDTWSLKLGIGL